MTLPSRGGIGFDGTGYSIKRQIFDDYLLRRSLQEGTQLVTGRVSFVGERGQGAELICEGQRCSFDIIVGADGANSVTAKTAGLVDEDRVEMGFALRRYLDGHVAMPRIDMLAPESMGGLLGYGWTFPNSGGVNAGVGVAVGQNRSRARGLHGHLDRYVAKLEHLLSTEAIGCDAGGWLKMGMIGTLPARGRVLLVGDAAGLVNPFQGEGIAAAIESGRFAAEAIMTAKAGAAIAYRRRLYDESLAFQSTGHLLLRVARQRTDLAGSALRGLVTLGRRHCGIAAGWGLFWNDLTAQSGPVPGGGVARGLALAGTLATRCDPIGRRYRASEWTRVPGIAGG